MGSQFSLIVLPLLAGAFTTQTIIMSIIFPDCSKIALSHLCLGCIIGVVACGIGEISRDIY